VASQEPVIFSPEFPGMKNHPGNEFRMCQACSVVVEMVLICVWW